MAWRAMDVREQRVRFVVAASRGEHRLSRLCVEFGISRPTGYKWMNRYRQEGVAGLAEQSRRPHHSPAQTASLVEERIVALRQQRPDWGARKLAVLLATEGVTVPVVTVHRVLLRHGLVREQDRHRPALQRFERQQPNQLWQMDFKSPKGWGYAVGPLSVIDDASRYLIALDGIWTPRGEAVRERLETAFAQCGLPEEMLMDHGCPWCNLQASGGWTRLSVWLMKQGIQLHFSGIRHPQTQGKVERFHGALEMARRRRGLPDSSQFQPWLDAFRQEYNSVRPHEALGMKTPASVWQKNPRRYDPNPAPWPYQQGAELARLENNG
jgi:transposase InsO family protein